MDITAIVLCSPPCKIKGSHTSLLPLLPLFSYYSAPTARPVPLFTLLRLLALLYLPPLLPCQTHPPPLPPKPKIWDWLFLMISCVCTVGQLHSYCTKLNIIMTILSCFLETQLRFHWYRLFSLLSPKQSSSMWPNPAQRPRFGSLLCCPFSSQSVSL